MRLDITQSELGAFRTCRRRWHLAYEERLRPIRSARPLRVGSLIHTGAEAMYRLMAHATDLIRPSLEDALEVAALAVITSQKEAMKSGLLTPDTIEEGEGDLAEALPTVARYVTRWFEEDLERYEVIGVEGTFEVPLVDAQGTDRSRITLSGMFDRVMRDRETGGLVLGELKSTVGAAHAMDLKSDVDPQVPAYIYAMSKKYGEQVGRVLYDVVRKKGPREPKVNKDGKVSTAAIDTTFEMYMAALGVQAHEREIPIIPKQQALLETLPRNTDRYIYRHEMYVSPDRVEQWREDAHGDARAMRMVRRGILPISRNGASCRPPWVPDCTYRAHCHRLDPDLAEGVFEINPNRHPELHGQEPERETDNGK